MIVVTADPTRKLVRVRVSGMLSVEEVLAFSAEEQAAVRGMALGSGEFVLLVEMTDTVVQTQPVMSAFRELMLHSPLKARRIANVREGVLNRMQSRRVAGSRDGVEVFATVAEAEAWLFAP